MSASVLSESQISQRCTARPEPPPAPPPGGGPAQFVEEDSDVTAGGVGTGGIGTAGNGIAGNGSAGNGTGTNGTGSNGSGTNGSGTNGSGTNGTAGNGNGTNGTGNDGGTGGPPGDPAQCEQLAQAAQRCCGNPNTCMTNAERSQVSQASQQIEALSAQLATASTSTQSGMSQYCAQTDQMNMIAARANNVYANACMREKSACTQACQAGTQGSSGSRFSQALGVCSRLSASRFTSQASSNAQVAGGGGACNQLLSNPTPMTNAGMPGMGGLPQLPMGAGGATDDPYGCAANPNSPACQSCTQNPNQPACRAMAAASKDTQGESGFAKVEDSNKKNEFNLPDLGDMKTGQEGGKNIQPQGITNGTIANNSGGGIPGGSTNPASLGGGPRGSPGSPGYNTDVLQGTFSGGGGSGGAGAGFQPQSAGQDGQWDGGRGGSRTPAGFERANIDLKRYLPGGDLDPHRRIGGFDGVSAQINNKYVDIWKKISNRLQEKCRLKILVGCD